MIALIIIAVILSYVLTVGVILYVVAKDGEFETVGELCGWVYEYYGIVFVPVLNTLAIIIAVLLYPVFRLAIRVGKIKLKKKVV